MSSPGRKCSTCCKKIRPEDKNLRVGVGKVSGSAVFYEMDVDSVSTFNTSVAQNNQYNKSIVSQNKVEILTLAEIFINQFMVYGQVCDLLSVDVEGNNFEVLAGNDWQRFRPSYIIIEMPAAERLDIVPYLYQKGYFLIFDNSLNGIFKDSGVAGPHPYPDSFSECLKPHRA